MTLAEVLRARGSRVTQARQLVWDALESIDGHATAQQILDSVEERCRGESADSDQASSGHAGTDQPGVNQPGVNQPAINQSSVYRALQLFAELGLIRESRTDAMGASTWELRHADGEIHLVCERCGDVTHYATDTVEALGAELRGQGFSAAAIDVQAIGVCADCGAATDR